MSDASGTKRRWLASALGAAVATVALLMLFRGPAPQSEPTRRAKPGAPIQLSPRRSDELAIRDPAPLFLPTRYNAEPHGVHRREPGATFLDEDATRPKFAETDPQLHLPTAIHVPTAPVEVLADVPGPLAVGIGQTETAVAPVQPHSAFLQVFAAATGDADLGATLGTEARPPTPSREAKPWHPLEFMAAVDASGLVGPLVLTTGSGADDVDNFFRTYLAQRFHLGERLTPGFYRIVVGP